MNTDSHGTDTASAPGLQPVAYLLLSFPEPSETFIADEAWSMHTRGQPVRVFHLKSPQGRAAPRSAERLIRAGLANPLEHRNWRELLGPMLRVLRHSPRRALATLLGSLRHPQRWLRLQALALAERCLSLRVGLLHVHFADTNLAYAAAVNAWTGLPYGVTTHGYDLVFEPLGQATAAALFRGAAVVVTISEHNRRHMVQRYGLAPQEVHVVHCGIDLQRHRFQPRPAPDGGRRWRLLNVGRLVPAKAQDVLLRALAEVRRRGIAAELDILGGGELEAELRALAQELGLSQQVRFHGPQPDSQVVALLGQCDLFVLPSRREGLPVALMEAMASGIPVVASRLTGIPELVQDRVNGLLVNPDDEASLVEALVWAHAHPQELPRLAEAARASVQAGFDRQTCSAQLAALWQQAMQTR